jgi:hypothetical protein
MKFENLVLGHLTKPVFASTNNGFHDEIFPPCPVYVIRSSIMPEFMRKDNGTLHGAYI